MLLANPTASQYICNVYIYIAPNEKIYFNVLKINFVHNADIFRSVHFLLFGDILNLYSDLAAPKITGFLNKGRAQMFPNQDSGLRMSAFRKSEGNEVPTRVRKRIWEEGVDVDGNMILG